MNQVHPPTESRDFRSLDSLIILNKESLGTAWAVFTFVEYVIYWM